MKTLPLLLCGLLLTGCAAFGQDPNANVGTVSSATPSATQPNQTVLAARDSGTRLR